MADTPAQLRDELQHGDDEDLRRRRAIIGLSFVGMGALGVASLFQTGVIKHLPDPPIPGFDSDRVNSSDTAYLLGAPDGPLAVASLAANLPLAAFGGADRATKQPIVPLLAAGKSVVEAAVSAWYFAQMPLKEKAWCGYCIVGALANVGIAYLTLPEAKKALAVLRGATL